MAMLGCVVVVVELDEAPSLIAFSFLDLGSSMQILGSK
jgi:hypothetical protein